LYIGGRIVAVLGGAMTSVAIGWEMYERTHSATALGLVGLTFALPVIFLALPAGHVADRYDRKLVSLISLAATTLCTFGLAFVSHFHDKIPDSGVLEWCNSLLHGAATLFGEPNAVFTEPAIPLMFLLLLGSGISMTFFAPARQAMLPNIIPLSVFSNAVTWGSSAFQLSSVFGPMLGGFLIATTGHYAIAYLMDAISTTICFFTIAPMRYTHQDHTGGERITLKTLGAGIKYVRDTKIILATITLDLFAVFLGGAVALLPMFAKDILNVGAMGLGWLRAAPSMGAFLMAISIAHRPMKHAGMALLWAVIGFGAATIVFGLSHSFWLSMLMLFLTGAFDNISVVIRATLVQLLTPDEMRGRVSAVNNVFIGTSNELGGFESGVTAALFGPVISVVAGGIGTILVVITSMFVWPQLRKFGKLDQSDSPKPQE
jgi:MFS family permease